MTNPEPKQRVSDERLKHHAPAIHPSVIARDLLELRAVARKVVSIANEMPQGGSHVAVVEWSANQDARLEEAFARLEELVKE